MSTFKSLLFACGITAFSMIVLTMQKGVPTPQQAITGGISMFAISFLVMKCWGGDNKKSS